MKELIARVEELAVELAFTKQHAERVDVVSDHLNDAIAKRNAELSELRSSYEQLREVNRSLAPKSALNQAVQEAAELRSEVVKLRAEVPLESTREGLKNAVAKLQEVTTDRDRVLNELAAIVAEANKTGRCGGDPVALIKQGHADWVAMERMERGIEVYSSLANARALENRKLIDGHAEDMKAHAEVSAQLDSTKGEAEEWLKQCHAARRQRDEVKAEARKETQRLSDLCAELQSKHEILLAAQNTVKADVAMVYQIADKLGRNQAESIPEFMERQALRLAALESKAGPSIETLSAELSVRYSEIAELHKWALVLIENPSFAKNAPEHTRNYRDIVERINSRPQLDLTATLPTVDWQGVASNMQREIARLNAKLGPLQKLFAQLNHHCRENAVSEHVGDIYCQVAEAKTELDRLTA